MEEGLSPFVEQNPNPAMEEKKKSKSLYIVCRAANDVREDGERKRKRENEEERKKRKRESHLDYHEVNPLLFKELLRCGCLL